MKSHQEFEEALKEVGMAPARLSPSEAAAVFQAMEQFAHRGNAPLWERTVGALSRRDPKGWMRIAEITCGPQLLLFDGDAYRFESPEALGVALGESFHAVSYERTQA